MLSPDVLLKQNLDRMPSLISDEVMQQAYSSGGQANALVWVLSLGRTRLGWCALQALFEVVDLHTEGAAQIFFLCCAGDGNTPWYFASLSNGLSRHMGRFTRCLYISFDISEHMNGMDLFRVNLMHFIPTFTSLQSLTFEIREWNDSNTFVLMTQPGFQYPASLHTVRMLSVSLDCSKACILCSLMFGY